MISSGLSISEPAYLGSIAVTAVTFVVSDSCKEVTPVEEESSGAGWTAIVEVDSP